MNPDGNVVIGVKLNTKQLEKDLKSEESKLKNYEKQHDVLIKAKVKIEKSKAMKEYQQLKDAIEKSYETKIDMTTGEEEESLRQKYLEKQNEELKKLDEAYAEQFSKIEEINTQLQENETHQQLIKTNIDDINTEISQKNRLDNIKNEVSSIKNETEGVLKKVAKWGLAIFSVRSAYMLIRQSVSTLSQYNEKLGTDIQYIRFVLATTLQPIIEGIIKLVYKLLAYIKYIAKEWFGVTLFADASAKAFQKANKGVKDTNKSAKQLQKTLAGFDEMNILQDTGDTIKGGGGGGIPSTDLSKELDKAEIPGWVDWIATHKDTILETLKQIAIMIVTAFAVKKILDFADGISKISGLLNGMSGLQIFGIIMGVATTIWGIIEVINALSDDTVHLEDVLKGVSDAIIGIGIVVSSFTPWGWVILGVGLLGELISSLIDTRTDAEKLEEANQKLEESQRKVNDAYEKYVNASKIHLNAFKNLQKAQEELRKTAKSLGITEDKLNEIGGDLFEGIRNGTIDINSLQRGEEDLTKTYGLSKEQLLKVYEAYVNVSDSKARLQTATDNLTTSEKNLSEAQRQERIDQLDQQKVIADTKKSYEDYRDAVVKAYDDGAISGEEATERLIEAFAKTDDASKQTFVDEIPGYMQSMMKEGATLFGGLGIEWRNVTDDMKIYNDSLAGNFSSKFGTQIPKSIQKSVDKVNSLTKKMALLKDGKVLGYRILPSGMATGGILKLASGAVINQPGRGVPLASNVIGGEHGREGILPLTDSQAMAQLGYEIGKNVTINAYLNNYMNARLIGREMQKVQNEDNFAYNG